jgi:hypothetical protein
VLLPGQVISRIPAVNDVIRRVIYNNGTRTQLWSQSAGLISNYPRQQMRCLRVILRHDRTRRTLMCGRAGSGSVIKAMEV